MLIWRLAAVIFFFRWVFRDPKVDLRFLVAGVVIPDVIDLTTATLLGAGTGELWAHTLAAPSVVAVGVVAATRRGRRRRAWMALVVAWLLHLLVDMMWLDARVLLWPFFGWDLLESGDLWAAAWRRARSDPWRWVLEGVGLGYLVRLWFKSGLTESVARRRLVRSGRLGNDGGRR